MPNTKHTSPCPHCGEDIPRNASKCSRCHEWIASEEERHSNHLSLGKLFVLTVLSDGLYFFYWFYRNWKHFGVFTGKKTRPMLFTAGLCVPVLDMILAGIQFWQIRSLSLEKNIKPFSFVATLLAFIVVRTIMWAAIFATFAVPEFQQTLSLTPHESYMSLSEALLITLIPAILLASPQRTLNALWAQTQPKKFPREHYSSGEVALLVIGGFFWLFLVLAPFIPLDMDTFQNFFNENVS